MRIRTLLAALAVACLLSAVDGTSGKLLRRQGQAGGDQQQPMEPFAQVDTEYVFIYNAQIAAGLIAQSAEDAQDAQQQAVTRIRCRAQIQFASERHGQLRLQQCEVGQQNEQMSEPQKVQPMQAFEEKTIPEEKQQQLEQACQFAYEDGVIKNVQFQDGEQAWAKNMKRAVLNMIQMNLKNAGTEHEQPGQQQSSAQRAQNIKQGTSFTIPETTLEGDCQTTYSINKAGAGDKYNVTKTINFKKCQQIADVAYGYQTEQPQPQCAQCQQYWAQQQQQSGQQPISTPAEQAQQQQQQQAGAQHPCAKCDPKEVNEQELDRSTVVRCQIQGPPSTSTNDQQEQYALKRCELLSQYVYRNVKSADGKYGSAMQTVVAATLEARNVRAKAALAQQIPSLSTAKFESLMYSNEWDVDAKRFFMFGEQQFNGKDQKSPFHQVPTVQQAEQALRKLVQSMQDEEKGIEAHASAELRRLVRMMRMSTQPELKRIEQEAVQQQGEKQQQQAKQLFTDALAMCGTHCCVAQLVQKIQQQQIGQKKAVQALIALKQLPAPSDAILAQVQELCQSAPVMEKAELKQTCWLTFGALVNELCAHPTAKNAAAAEAEVQRAPLAAAKNAKQSGFFKQDHCPADKKQQYMESMMAVYKDATCINDKMIALAAIGNAGMDTSVSELEQIIKRPQEARVVRCKAIDALRRLRTQMPRKLQRVLLPLFQNTREQPMVRCAAFAILAQTLPEPAIVDQLMFTIVREPSKQVLAYAYQTMKMMVKSRQPNVQQIARHIKSALKLAKVDEQQLRSSGEWQFALAYSAKQQEGVFASFGTAISQRSALPEYAHVQLDTQFNDQFAINEMKVYAMQQEVEQWYAQIAQKYSQSQGSATRAQRQQQRHASTLNSIYQALGIKSRRSQQSDGISDDFDTYAQQATTQNQQPYAMLAIRTNNVDQAFWALDMHTMSPDMRALVSGERKPSMRALLGEYRNKLQAATIATKLGNKYSMIPTSVGMPLYVQTTMPALASIDGSVSVTQQQERDSLLDMQLQINVKATGRLAHIQKMKCWTPFAVTAVQSTRSAQFNAPLHAEVQSDDAQQQQQGGIAINVKLPKQNTRLASAHSLPITYTAEVDAKTGLEREPKHIRTIRSAKLDRLQKEVNIISGRKQLAMPLHIQGHFHCPATPSSYAQLVQKLMATENLVQVTYQPGQDSPREAIFRISAAQFQKISQREQPDAQLHAFYDAEFDSPYECEPEQCVQGECEHCEHFEQQQQWDAQQEMGNAQQRKQQLQRFITAFKQNNMQQYKHVLKFSAQTQGGAQDAKAQCEIQAQCDAKLQFCKVKVDAEKVTPNANSPKWTLKAQAQLVMPQTVASVHDLAKLQQRNGQQQQQQQQQQFIAHAQAQWGAEQKQKVEIRVQGSQAHSPQVRRVLQQEQQQQLFIKPSTQRAIVQRSAFLNKFKLAAKYTLKPSTLNKIQQAVELLKSRYYWNSRSQLTGQPIQQNGQVSAFINIDPITAQHANVTIKTADQQVQLQEIQLPQRVRPFALIQQHSAAQTHSLGQLINRFSVSSRAQCTADGQRVQTFDDSEFAAPLSSKCFTVLAKDCASEQPQFVVLMKKQAGEKKGQFGQKKLKVITPENAIECQPNGHAGNKLICKLNGQQVHEETAQQDDQQQPLIQFNNARKSDVTIHVPGIAVRFNGRKAWLKLAPQHKQTQCGLCGHYDDSDAQQDEWRMPNGQIASSQPEFHRSFTLLGEEEEQCTKQELDQFYQQQQKGQQQNSDNYFQQLNSFDDGSSSEEADEEAPLEQEQDEQQQQQYWLQKDEQFDGRFSSSEEYGNSEDDEYSSEAQYNQLFSDEPEEQECCCCCAKSCEQKCGGDSQCAQRCKQQCKQQCQPDSAEQCKQQCKNGQCQQQQKQKTKCKGKRCEREVSPVWKTMVKEEAHAVCFSAQPVKQCPRGSYPADRASTSDYESADASSQQEDEAEDEQQPQQQQQQRQAKTKKVSFVCMNRAKPEARRLLRQLRNGQRRVVNLSSHGASYTEQVREPQQCVRTRQRRAGGDVRLF